MAQRGGHGSLESDGMKYLCRFRSSQMASFETQGIAWSPDLEHIRGDRPDKSREEFDQAGTKC